MIIAATWDGEFVAYDFNDWECLNSMEQMAFAFAIKLGVSFEEAGFGNTTPEGVILGIEVIKNGLPMNLHKGIMPLRTLDETKLPSHCWFTAVDGGHLKKSRGI